VREVMAVDDAGILGRYGGGVQVADCGRDAVSIARCASQRISPTLPRATALRRRRFTLSAL